MHEPAKTINTAPPKGLFLNEKARTLIFAFRWWLTGQSDPTARERARAELKELVGLSQAEVVSALFDIITRAVARYPARTIHYHPPWCHTVTPDEALLLTLTSACQCGEMAWSKTLAGLITTTEGEAILLDAANELAQVLLAAGIVLPICVPWTAQISLETIAGITMH